MTTIFDLDYTLFDAAKLKNDLAEIFSGRDFMDDYRKYFKESKVNFNLDKYLEILKSEEAVGDEAIEEMRSDFAELLSRLDQYLFPAAAELLRFYKDKGDKMILISKGDKDLQAEKISHLSIKEFFDQIIIVDEKKRESELWQELKDKNEKILIINDDAEESLEILESLGGRAELKLIDGPYSRNVKHERKIYKLEELLSDLNREKAEESLREIKIA